MYARIYCIYTYYARSITSIMPGQTWRDTGHKALCPVSGTNWDDYHSAARACMYRRGGGWVLSLLLLGAAAITITIHFKKINDYT